MSTPERPRSLTGHKLEGIAPLRFIYLDEAGISIKEPVSVVAGIIVDADKDWLRVNELLSAIIQDHVPAHFKDGFVFHAKAIWGDKALRNDWTLEERVNLIKAVLRIPRRLGIPFAMGSCRRDVAPSDPHTPKEAAITQHVMAFSFFAGQADRFMRESAAAHEVATMVAEDCPDMRAILRNSLQWMREETVFLDRRTQLDSPASGARDIELKVTRIIDTIHFVEKRSAPLLQIADAIAFAFRRFLSDQSRGIELLSALMDFEVTRDILPGVAPSTLCRWTELDA